MRNPYLRSVVIISLILSLFGIFYVFIDNPVFASWPLLLFIVTVGSAPAVPFVLLLGLAGGVLLGFIGPLVIFTGWFIFLYGITYLYSLLKDKNNIIKIHRVSNKVFFSICFILLIIACIFEYELTKQVDEYNYNSATSQSLLDIENSKK